jgi:phosphomannomutase
MNVFKAYDIRGIYNKGIDNLFAYKLGRAFGRFSKARSIVTGYDARSHSSELYKYLIKGLYKEGKTITGIGICSTPQLHFCQIKRNFDAGIMVTASHNPPEYHGFKFFDSEGGSISYAKGLKTVEEIIKDIDEDGFTENTDDVADMFSESEGISDYINFLVDAAGSSRLSGRKIVVDCANGSAGMVFKLLSERLNLNAHVINSDPDGSFPNHNPNPLEKKSRDFISLQVRKFDADLGVLLDGDGDRIIFIDDNGEVIENYFASALISDEILKEKPDSAIVYDLISSRVLPENIIEAGGKPVVSKVGYTFIYDTMLESNAVFGTETSGHVYFKVDKSFYTESAAYALIILLRMISGTEKSVSELVEPLRKKYSQAPEINLKVNDKEESMKKIEKKYSDTEIIKLDGLSISYKDYWFNVRPSNTEPLLRLRLEAVSEDTARTKADEIVKLLKS